MSCRDKAYIINMDQTPVPFSYDPKNIEVVGRRTIHIRKSTSNMECATCALTVTASGKMITSLFVFKCNNNMMKCFSPFFAFLREAEWEDFPM